MILSYYVKLYVLYLHVDTGVPTLAQMVSHVNRMKYQRVAGVKVRDMLELKELALKYEMPKLTPALALPHELLDPNQLVLADHGPRELRTALSKVGATMAVPMSMSRELHGQCFTGPVQIGWVMQLLKMPKRFCLHVDGKYKLHHGGFVLISIGTHWLFHDTHHSKLSNSFAPLVYLFCKEQESLAAARALVEALCRVSMTYGGALLDPGATFSDHSDAFRTSLYERFGAPHGSCYPHIKRKWHEGATRCPSSRTCACLQYCLIMYAAS